MSDRDEQIKKLAEEPCIGGYTQVEWMGIVKLPLKSRFAMMLIAAAFSSIRKDEEIAAAYDRGWRVGLESATGMAQEEIARKDEAIAALKEEIAAQRTLANIDTEGAIQSQEEIDSLREAIAAKDKLLAEILGLANLGPQHHAEILLSALQTISRSIRLRGEVPALAAIRERGKD